MKHFFWYHKPHQKNRFHPPYPLKTSRNHKVLYDGNEVTLYDANDISLYNLDGPRPNLIIDPRDFGLSATLTSTARIDWFENSSMKESMVELVGAEVIDGKNTWHVRLIDSSCIFNWWIDDKNGFRVYRYAENMGKLGHNEINSFYDESYPWLPTNIVVQRVNGADIVTGKTSITIFKTEANVKFPDNTWTLAGMGLPTNDIPVTDMRIDKVVGYWNGVRIRPYSEPVPHKPLQPVPPPVSPRRTFFMVLMLVMFIAPLGWLIKSNLKKK